MKQLTGISANNSPPNSALAVAGATVAAEEAKKEAEISRKCTEEKERRELAKDAVRSLDVILEMIFEAIESDAPVARRLSQTGIEVGSGKLRIEIPFPFSHKGGLFKLEERHRLRGIDTFGSGCSLLSRAFNKPLVW